jgi:signal transduction histidine kinase/ligand-binding sensor domain-containing protein
MGSYAFSGNHKLPVKFQSMQSRNFMRFRISQLKQTAMFKIVISLFLLITLYACNQNSEIPFPTDTGQFPAPVKTAIKFGPVVNILWTDKPARLSSVQGNFNYDNLPTVKFDSLGFEAFPTAPEESPINFSKLPAREFNYDSLPTIPLKFKTSLLTAPVIIPIQPPTVKAKKGDIVYDFGGLFTGVGVRRIYKSRDGSTWISSRGKLCRYDGETVTEYTINGLNSNFRDMFEDEHGRFWCASSQDGLFFVDIKSGISRQLSVDQGLPNKFCLSLIADDRHRIWLSTLPDGYQIGAKDDRGAVVILDLTLNTLKIFRESDGLSHNTPTSLIRDKENRIWIGTINNGVNVIDLNKKSISYLRKTEGLLNDSITCVIEDRKGRFWFIGAWGDIAILDGHHGTLKRFTERQGVQRVFTYRVIEDKSGDVWIGSDQGIKVVSADLRYFKVINRGNGLNTNISTQITEDATGQILIGNEIGLNMIKRQGKPVRHVGNAQISTLMEDSHGRVWVGTLDKGIQIVDPGTNLAKLYDRAHGISDDLIQYIVEYHGKVIISTQKGGIEIIDTSLKKIERIGPAQGIAAGNITAIETDNNENIWLAGTNNGLDILDLKNKHVRHIGPGEGLDDSLIIDVKKDLKGQIWFYSYKNGIAIFDIQHKTVKHIVESEFKSLTGAYEDNLLMHDSKGNTWLTSSQNGLFMINPTGDSVTHLSITNGLLNNGMLSIKEHDGKIYAGTRRGLNIITPPKPGSTDNWKIVAFGKTSGIEKTVASYNSDLLRRNGDYWWGDDGITIMSNGDEMGKPAMVPPTYITGLNIFNRRQRFFPNAYKSLKKDDTIWINDGKKDSFYLAANRSGHEESITNVKFDYDSLSGIYQLPVNLQLPYNQNYLQFRFGQRNLGAVDTTWYRYVFEGIDKKWSDRTYENFSENYPNLSPGAYTFRVSSFYDGKWCDPISYSFTILPPWWQTWWAYLLYAAIGTSVLRAYIVYRSRKLRRENKVLEEKVILRTNQLQKSFEDLKATQSQLIQSEKMASLGELTAGIAHEIQNPLNFVNNFSELNKELLAEMNEEIAMGNLEEVKKLAKDIFDNEDKINHHSKRAEGIVKGMLQHSRISNAVKEPADLNKVADEYFRLAYHGLRAKDKSFNATLKTDYDLNIKNINIIPQDLGRVILNLITNAFYAVNEKMNAARAAGNMEYAPTVTVSTRKLANRVEIKVADNGNGIPEKIVNKIFQPFFTTKPAGQGTGLGLSMSYEIVTQGHGGELNAKTTENEGTVFTVSLPI